MLRVEEEGGLSTLDRARSVVWIGTLGRQDGTSAHLNKTALPCTPLVHFPGKEQQLPPSGLQNERVEWSHHDRHLASKRWCHTGAGYVASLLREGQVGLFMPIMQF